MTVPITIIGGGVVGLSIAHELVSRGWKDVVLLEKNNYFGQEQTERSSGVMHSGVFLDPKTLMAKLCFEGLMDLYQLCEEHNISHIKSGKYVVAQNTDEMNELEKYLAVGTEMGILGLDILKPSQFEHNIQAVAALTSPYTGVISAPSLINTLDTLISQKHNNPDMVMCNTEVTDIGYKNSNFVVYVSQDNGADKNWSIETEILINSAGLGAVDIAKKINPDIKAKKKFLKGHFYQMSMPVNTNIYPVPDDIKLSNGYAFRDYKIHITPVAGNKNNTRGFDFAPEVLVGPWFTQDMNAKPDKSLFIDYVQSVYPWIKEERLYEGHTGVLGLIEGPMDFQIFKDKKNSNCIQMLGIGSPSLTACQRIAKYTVDML